MSAPSYSTESYTPDRLHAGDFPIRSEDGTLITGQNLTRGAVLGKITASGKLNLSLSAAGDGSEVPYAILSEDMDATAADKQVIVYLSGDVNQDSLTIGAGHTAASIKDGLRDKSIFLRAPQTA